MGKLSILILLIFLLMNPMGVFCEEIPKVTVAKFKNSTKYNMQSTDSVTDNFISLLMESKRFDVLERERLRDLNEESIFSGQTKIEGCDYIFLNNISTMDVTTTQSKVKILKLASKTAEVSVQVNVRIVDAKTGKIMHSLFGEDKQREKITTNELFFKNNKDPMSNELINNTMRAALKQVVDKIVATLFPVKIVTVKDGQIYLNAGENMGVTKDAEFDVYSLGEDIIDPDTGLNLGSEEKYIGRVKVTDVKEKYSLGTAKKEVMDQIVRGQVCRPKEAEAKK